MLSDGSGTPAWNTCVYDPCGNLVFDGDYYFQYDAWGRLIEVRDAGNLRWQHFTAAGVPRAKDCPAGFEAGPLVKHFTYDGVGRVIRTSSRMTAPDGYEFSYVVNGVTQYAANATRSERFYYDGVRRVQDIVTEPVLVTDNPEERDTVTLTDEVYQSNTSISTGPYVRAQYVWGPGDNGVDELLCQLDPRDTSQTSYSNGGGKPWYVLTDAQGDVVAMAHVPPGSNQVAEVGGQWTYSPYGEVLTYEKLHPHPVMVFGHKTLAIDRLDGEVRSWDFEEGSVSENPRLMPGARTFGCARNRTDDLTRGRPLQNDPNASGIALIDFPRILGGAPVPPEMNVDLATRLTDGPNLYQYVRSGPLMQSDPLGLFGFIDVLGGSTTTAGLQADWMQQIGEFGNQLKSMTSGLLQDYGLQQAMDFEWALDMNAPDDFYAQQQMNSDPFAAEAADPEFAMGGIASTAGRIVGGNLRKVSHHIATRYGRWGQEAGALFRSCGMSINDMANKLPVLAIHHWKKGQRGHNVAYKNMVIVKLQRAVANIPLDQINARKDALTRALKELAEEITKNPRMINHGP